MHKHLQTLKGPKIYKVSKIFVINEMITFQQNIQGLERKISTSSGRGNA